MCYATDLDGPSRTAIVSK